MSNEKNDRDIEKRSFDFAVRIIKMANSLPRSAAAGVIARQVLRAGTSIGANVEEAQGAPTKKDFARRMNIARSEAREALYWLRLIRSSNMLPSGRMNAILTKADELVRILTAIVKKARES